MSDRSPPLSSGSSRFDDAPSVLSVLAEPEVDTVVYRRSLDPALARALDEAARGWIAPASRVLDPSQRSLPESIASLVASAPPSVRGALAEDVDRCLQWLSAAAGPRPVLATLGSVIGDECTRFHQDFVRVRLLVTYAGPGTVLVRRSAVDRHALAHPVACEFEANRAIVRDPSAVTSAVRGDVVLLKGGAWPSIEHGAVHRSPSVRRAEDRRVVLALTQVADERTLAARPVLARTDSGQAVLLYPEQSLLT
jgi:hypothetical protein